MPSLMNPFEALRPKFSHQDLIGWVIDAVDPEKKQRVKIRIPQLHRNVPDEKLPWSIPDNTQGTNNAGSGVGSVNVPPKGSKIFVRFEDNDPHNPRYGGSPATDDVNKDNEFLKEDYPHTRGSTDIAGNRMWTVNTEKETIDLTHKSGTTIHLDANGVVSIAGASDINIGAQGNINIVAKGNTNIFGAKIHLNNGSAEAASVSPRTRPTITDQSGNTGY